MILVQLMHLTLDREPSREWISSVRCAALECVSLKVNNVITTAKSPLLVGRK